MDANNIANWMISKLQKDGCIYQDDVVDYLIKSGAETLLRENSDGNQVLARPVLDAFMKVSTKTVVWVKPERYWRWRVQEDELGREAKG